MRWKHNVQTIEFDLKVELSTFTATKVEYGKSILVPNHFISKHVPKYMLEQNLKASSST
jgi:hypothetical protein